MQLKRGRPPGFCCGGFFRGGADAGKECGLGRTAYSGSLVGDGQSAVAADAEPRPAGEAAPVLVRFEGVGKRFDGPAGPVAALEGVGFQIRRGEIFGIIGRSGAGKSTLIRCVNRLERPSSGSVGVAGQDVGTLSARDLARLSPRLALVTQHSNILAPRPVVGTR